ncbi:MAG TPA: hypothetical protein VMS43_13860 [Allosphingosinicella sp.]|nr:hypothetical protein [Allosphingosinicella sp.]
MNPFTSMKAAIGFGVAIAFALLLAWALRVDHLRAEWKKQTETITSAVETAAGLRNLKPKDAAAAVATIAGNLRTCRENGARLQSTIDDQNRAVEALRRDGAARIAALDRAAIDARQGAQAALQRAAAILASRGTGDDCADAEALINREIAR